MIDVHAHYVPASYTAALSRAGIDRPDGFPHLPRWDVREAIASMDELGIATAILSISSPGVSFAGSGARPTLAREVNDEGAAIVRAHPGRFGLLATLPLPDLDASLAELARALDVLDADGVVLMTNYDGIYLGDPHFEPLMAELDRRGAVAALHPTSPPGWEAVALGRPRPLLEFPIDTTRAVFNLVLARTLERHPRIRVIVPHAGAAVPALADRIDALANALGDDHIDVHAVLRRVWFDLAGGPYDVALAGLVALAQPDRLLYGSDLPFTPRALVSAATRRLEADGGLDAARLAENALELFPRLRSAQTAVRR